MAIFLFAHCQMSLSLVTSYITDVVSLRTGIAPRSLGQSAALDLYVCATLLKSVIIDSESPFGSSARGELQ